MRLSLSRSFVDHPRSVGETYGEHFAVALGFGVRLIGAGFACLVHACVPAWFTRSGSSAVRQLAHELEERARGRSAVRARARGVARHRDGESIAIRG